MPLLSAAQVTQGLSTIQGWQVQENTLTKTFTFKDFLAAMRFVNSVAELAERAGHHPDIDIRYNKVKLALSSHDAGGITEMDFSLAKEIAKLT